MAFYVISTHLQVKNLPLCRSFHIINYSNILLLVSNKFLNIMIKQRWHANSPNGFYQLDGRVIRMSFSNNIKQVLH
jgi:hypothetical protein